MHSSRFVEAIASPVWSALAWQDIVTRYRRSTLGPFWFTLTTAFFIVGVGTLYGGLFGRDSAVYMLYFGTGFILWQFISSTLSEGATALIGGRDMLLNARIEPLVMVLRVVARNLLTLVHTIPVYLLLLVYAQPANLTVTSFLLAIPGLIALVINTCWMGALVAIAGVRYRDVPPIISSVTQLLFLITPIFWEPQAAQGIHAAFVHFNPFAHILIAAREPLIGSPLPLESLAISLALAALGVLGLVLLYRQTARKIPYWL